MSSSRNRLFEVELEPIIAPSSAHIQRPHTVPLPAESSVLPLVNVGVSVEESRPHVVELAPIDRGKGAWIFIWCSFLMDMFVFGLPGSFGVFQTYYLNHPPFNAASEATINSIGTIALALEYFTVPFFVHFFQRRPKVLHPSMWAGTCTLFLSLFLCSFATSVWQLIVLQGMMFGVSSGLLYTPIVIYLSEWFVERRAFASSIIFGGACVGGAMLPFITDALLSSVGFSGSMRALSVISFVICSLGNLGIRPRVPPAPVASSARSSHRLPTINYRIFRTPLYVAVSLATALQAIGYYPVPFYIPSYAAALGLSSTDGTLALATFNLATLLGQVCGGTLCESLGYNVLMLASAVSSAAAVYIIWGFAHTSGLVYLFSVIFGAVSGVFTSSFASASADIAGRRNGQSASMVLASLGLWKGAAIVLGPIVSGVIHHSSKPIDPSKYSGYGFTGVILFVGSMLSATGLSVVVSMFLRVRHREF